MNPEYYVVLPSVYEMNVKICLVVCLNILPYLSEFGASSVIVEDNIKKEIEKLR